MLITREFVFIHLPKTGGDFIRAICETHFPTDFLVGHDLRKHGSIGDLPEAYRHLPVFALVRNPWDWYVSWYHYLMGSGRLPAHRKQVRARNNLFVRVSNDFQNEFSTTVANLFDDAFWARQPPGGRTLRRARRKDVGLLTMHVHRQLGDPPPPGVVAGRLESLRPDFLGFLRGVGLSLPKAFVRALERRRPLNRSRRRDFRTYYDDDLRALIGHKERAVISAHGYTFQPPATVEAPATQGPDV